MIDDTRIQAQYARPRIADALLDALRRAGKDLNRLAAEDLAPLDQFHVRGREATEELAVMAGLRPGLRVLDVGCGIGGPSRHLATSYGCRVVGIDLTEEYCRAAALLAQMTGLHEHVTYQQGNALSLPFDAGSFDVVWTQHAAMNIEQKPRLYAEVHRVLRPGGRFALYDVLAGPVQPIHFPVPWARDQSISFLIPPEELRTLLEQTGFTITAWRDVTQPAAEWFQRLRTPPQGRAPSLGPQVLMGPDWASMAANLARNLQENRVALIQAVTTRV